jgi:hypothetical protein
MTLEEAGDILKIAGPLVGGVGAVIGLFVKMQIAKAASEIADRTQKEIDCAISDVSKVIEQRRDAEIDLYKMTGNMRERLARVEVKVGCETHE